MNAVASSLHLFSLIPWELSLATHLMVLHLLPLDWGCFEASIHLRYCPPRNSDGMSGMLLGCSDVLIPNPELVLVSGA